MKELLKKFRYRYRDYRLRRIISRQKPLKIIIGSAGTCQKGWISTEQAHFDLTDHQSWKRLFRQLPIDALLAEHVWEHLTSDDGEMAANLCYQYLAKGGYVRVAVPDGFHPNPCYLSAVRPGGDGDGASDHKVLFTYQSLRDLFSGIGFQVKLLEYFDEHGKFHKNEWRSEDGHILRSEQFDVRNASGKLNYTSLIIDAIKR